MFLGSCDAAWHGHLGVHEAYRAIRVTKLGFTHARSQVIDSPKNPPTKMLPTTWFSFSLSKFAVAVRCSRRLGSVSPCPSLPWPPAQATQAAPESARESPRELQTAPESPRERLKYKKKTCVLSALQIQVLEFQS